MLKLILGFLSGPISAISNDLKEAYQSRLKAANETDRIAADERIAVLQAREAVLVSRASSRIDALVRLGFALPFVLYNAKLLVWDKVLGWGATDGLSPELSQIYMIVLGGFFLDTIVGKVVKKK